MDSFNDFLPNNYEVPESTGKYLKLKQGANRFRILSSAIVGYEGWKEADGKRAPIRKQMVGGARPSFTMDEITDPSEIKHFWAFFVFNYTEKRIQVFQVNQKSIQHAITALIKSPDWGDPKSFDIEITRSGEKLETEYVVQPIPPRPLAQEVQEAWDAIKGKVDLTRLFTNGDPFGEEQDGSSRPADLMRQGMEAKPAA